MKKGLFDRRIPTVFALLILVLFIIGLSTFLVKSGIFYIGKAAPDTTPGNLSITNVTDTSFTVAFTTKDAVEAAVALTNGTTGNTISLDDRDKKTGEKNKYFSHHITVLNLKPLADYFFKVLSGNDEYENTNFRIKTGSQIDKTPPSQNPIYGKVLNTDGTPGSDSLVFARTDGASVVTTYSNDKGEFIIPTNSLRNSNLNDYYLLTDDTNFEITVIKQNLKAKANATFKISQNLPQITLLQEYSFTNDANTNSPSTNSFAFVQDSQDPTTTPTPTIAPTATPTPEPTSTPTPTAAPTLTLTPTLTPIPTAQATPTPTPLPTIPVTPTKVLPMQSPGSVDKTYLLTGFSLLAICIGGIILFVL